MRKVLRNQDVRAYWRSRWRRPIVDPPRFVDRSIYPIRFVEPVVEGKRRILEAGCGLGRILRHYHGAGVSIVGFDFVEEAVHALKREDPSLRVLAADVLRMPFRTGSFDLALAFGVYHGFESLEVVRSGLLELHRVCRPGGIAVVSVRADTWENRIIDWVTERRQGKGKAFHKWCFHREEFAPWLEEAGFEVRRSELATNVPFLHKFACFRAAGLEEHDRRVAGYRLNMAGRRLYALLQALFPGRWGTTWVFIAEKPA